MATAALPQLDELFLTDAGLESDMIFNHGFDLPFFASVTMLRSDEGRLALERYFQGFIDLARKHRVGCLLETATWRASPDWAPQLGLSRDELGKLNGNAVTLLRGLATAASDVRVIVSGCLGPRGDGYDPGRIMSYDEAEGYHAWQAGVLAEAGADMLSAITMTNVNEAIGVCRAARRTSLPVAISFTVETDGLLPSGDQLGDAIEEVDTATGGYPAYFMINCAHPTHFAPTLTGGGEWTKRIRGVRANASKCSHAELDAMTELDDGNPVELGEEYRALRERLPQLNVLGGCCGTDLRHVAAIAESVRPAH